MFRKAQEGVYLGVTVIDFEEPRCLSIPTSFTACKHVRIK